MWNFSDLEDVARELRQAVRLLLRAPAHTLTIIALLAIGIGANAAMFSLVNAIYIRELPVYEPRRLVAITPGLSTAAFEDFRKQQHSFSGIMATGTMLGTVVADENGQQMIGVTGLFATGNYFEVLGVRPQLGRVFSAEDDRFSDPQPVMVLSSAFWRRQFAGDPKVLGRRVSLSGAPFTVIGVTQEGFFGELPGRGRDFWVPVNTQPLANPQGDLRRNASYRWMNMIGRLKPGEGLEQAQAEATVVYDRLFPLRPGQQRDPQSRMQLGLASRGAAPFRRQFETPVQVLAGIVVIVLLVICANVATLLLARGTARQREIAVRQAIGCSRARLIRQFLVEGLLLAGTGGLIGLLLAPSVARALLLMQPSFATARLDLSPDRNILLFGLGISFLTAMAFSLVPALRASRWDIEPALKSASRLSSGGRQRTLRFVIALQAALCLVLVTASLLFARSLTRLHEVDLGFDYEHIVSVTVNPRFAGYRDDAAQARLSQRLLDRLNVLPGVKSASAGLCAVLMGCSRRSIVNWEGHQAQPGDPEVWINPVYPNYFETIGTQLQMGRSFGPQDRPGSTRVAVVTEALARSYFPDRNPLGKHFTERAGGDPIEIVGVVRDMKFVTPRDPPIRMIFLSQVQSPGPFSYVQIRVGAHPEAMVATVRQAIMEVDSKLFLLGPGPLSDSLDHVLAHDLLLGRASALFGGIALLLACFGVYGVISYLVAARTTELGIRLAIGARPRAVLCHVIAHALKTILPGVVLGILAAFAAGRFIESLLFGISTHDPAVYAEVGLALLLTAALAAYLPALRASRIDPLQALRCE